MMMTGGSAFDPNDRPIYFIASNADAMLYGAPYHRDVLLAINELAQDHQLDLLGSWLDGGNRVFIDSGIYNLAMTHARDHDMSMDEALGLAPDEIDGFPDLWAAYCKVIAMYGDRTWGYIELDQGGRENKIKTRARLEALGFRPIPVYHPINDGWDYFDHLAANYDRICLGNVVQASSSDRVRLLTTIWHRARQYPGLWIHCLGVTPGPPLYTFPIGSADSSSWLTAVRWSNGPIRAMGRVVGRFPDGYSYVTGAPITEPNSRQRALGLAAMGVSMEARTWKYATERLTALGFPLV